MQESIVFLVGVRCRRKESSRSLSHLLMSFLSFALARWARAHCLEWRKSNLNHSNQFDSHRSHFLHAIIISASLTLTGDVRYDRKVLIVRRAKRAAAAAATKR